MNADKASFVIIGAGPVGLLTALAIRDRQESNRKERTSGSSLSIVVYERRSTLEQRLEESYPIGVAPRGMRALQTLCPAAAADVLKSGAIVKSWDVYAGSRHVSSIQSGTTLGHTRYSVTNALYRQAQEAGIEVKFGHKLRGLDTTRRELTFESASNKNIVVNCDKSIVIAADGANSATRELLVADAAKLPSHIASGFTPTRNTVMPWNLTFRVLVVDEVDTPEGVPLDPSSHSIYNGTYCALTGPPNDRRWIVVPSATKDQDHADWFFLDSEDPSSESMQSLRKFLAEKVPPLADTEKYFSDEEIRAFFGRKCFTGSLVSLAPLHYPHNMLSPDRSEAATDAKSWIVFLGDSAHSVYPATGEGLNSGLDDVLVFTDSVLAPAYSKDLPIDLSAYTATRQADVDALSSLAAEKLATMTGSPEARITNIIVMIVSSIARRLGLIGPSEAELRYGPNTVSKLIPYQEVLRRHRKDTGLIRAVVTSVVTALFSLRAMFV